VNRRAWFVADYGVLIVFISGDQVLISIAGEDYERFDRQLPEVDA
jgi:hypothetical protein